MKGTIAVVVLSGSLMACVQAQPPAATVAAPPPAVAPAPPQAAVPVAAPAGNRYVTIRSARCQTLLGLSEDDRAAASLFYIGYQAARLRARSINVNAIPDAESEALNYCQTFPNRTVAEAFAKAFLRVLR
jgi:HdeA/HdeB family protein